MNTLLINPPLVNGVAFTRQGRCQEREEVLGTTKPPYSLLVCAALFRERGIAFRFVVRRIWQYWLTVSAKRGCRNDGGMPSRSSAA